MPVSSSFYINSLAAIVAGEPATLTGIPNTTTICSQVSQAFSTISIACPSNSVISSVLFADYGLPQGTCSSGFVPGSCNYSHLAAAADICVGQSQCVMSASGRGLPDPCVNISKTTTLMAQCTAATSIPSAACASVSDAYSLVSVSCPTGYVVGSVLFASWGDTIGNCASGFSSGTCSASLLSIATSGCVGATSCVFPTGPGSGLSDPCTGTPKRTTVKANCSLAPVNPSTSCAQVVDSSSFVVINCGTRVISAVLFASWGVPSGSCNAGFTPGTCHAPFLGAATSTCVGQSSCTLGAGTYVGLADPCAGADKATTVLAQCADPATVSPRQACGQVADSTSPVVAVSCTKGYSISGIVFADWGTPSGNCSIGYSAGVCNSSNLMMAVAESACLGQDSCTFPVGSYLGIADPCVGTPKLTTLQVMCSNSQSPLVVSPPVIACGQYFETGVGDNKVGCPRVGWQISAVLFAGYGVAGGSCMTGFTPTTCHTSIMSAVSSACVGQSSCSFPLGGSLGIPDPCYGTPKSTTVAVQCAPPSTFAVTNDASGNVLVSEYSPSVGFAVHSVSTSSGLIAPFAGSLSADVVNASGVPAIVATVGPVFAIDFDQAGFTLLAGEPRGFADRVI